MALNNIDVMGRLVADPEIRTTPSDKKVANFRIAVDHDFKNKETGERGCDFFSVTAWNGTAEFVAQYFGKGDQMVINGRLQSRQYQDKENVTRTAIEIVANNVYFCGGKKSDGAPSEHANAHPAAQPSGEYAESDDGDLPF